MPRDVDQAFWAPILVEPIIGSGERVAVAMVAFTQENDFRCLPLLSEPILSILPDDDGRSLRELAHVSMESCVSHLRYAGSFKNWEPPVTGVYLGDIQTSMMIDLDLLVSRAATMTSFLYAPSKLQPNVRSKPSINWSRDIAAKLISANQDLARNVNVKVLLGRQNSHSVEFTFLNPHYAANTSPFTYNQLKNKVELARAALWELHLLEDAASYIFKPAKRELLAGRVATDSDQENRLIDEAIDEIGDEAEQRGVLVTTVESPDSAAKRILEQSASFAA